MKGGPDFGLDNSVRAPNLTRRDGRRVPLGTRTRHRDMMEALLRGEDIRGLQGEALRLVEEWNAALASGRPALWSPTIGAALIAERPWLHVLCPGCDQVSFVNLAEVRVDSRDYVGRLQRRLACRCCRGGGPLPQLRCLSRFGPW